MFVEIGDGVPLDQLLPAVPEGPVHLVRGGLQVHGVPALQGDHPPKREQDWWALGQPAAPRHTDGGREVGRCQTVAVATNDKTLKQNLTVLFSAAVN